ncbi:uncharacterized protein IL334_006138 [Kwoniella shivajii]|uniref:Uncharacterized protein n=1 Tax=Kwoniella shivajii TaxID=564305 RepID=A0ABZ1D753_9TREE|nr:hypothetical protein IL334_006138 [Kwoniella shivajii]
MIALFTLFSLPLLTLVASSPIKRQDDVNFTGYWPDYFVEIAGYNRGWTGGSGNYTYTGILTYPNQTTINETVIFENLAIHSYIYHFGDIDSYPSDSSFQFRIEDAADPSLYAEGPVLPIISSEEAYDTPA